MNNKFTLLRQLQPETTMPYRIIETYDTSDGRRSRICLEAYDIKSAAEAAIAIKEKITNG